MRGTRQEEGDEGPEGARRRGGRTSPVCDVASESERGGTWKRCGWFGGLTLRRRDVSVRFLGARKGRGRPDDEGSEGAEFFRQTSFPSVFGLELEARGWEWRLGGGKGFLGARGGGFSWF